MRGNLKYLQDNYPELMERAKQWFGADKGCEFDQDAYRMLPYLQYLAINTQKLDPAKINRRDKDIYLHLKGNKQIKEVILGSITQPISFIDKDFWDFTCDVLFVGYNATANIIPTGF